MMNILISMHVGKLLRKKRQMLGLTGVELGKRLNISQQQVSRYENGSNQITVDRLYQYCMCLDMKEYDIERFFEEIKKIYINCTTTQMFR